MGLKQVIQDFARAAGIYERLKESRLYDWYWTFFDPGLLRDRTAEVDFYSKLLAGSAGERLIFDIGANRGTKTSIFLKMGARVVTVEPDPVSLARLRRRFVRGRLRRLPITIVPKALCDVEGVETMWIDAPGSAKNTLSSKWVTTLRGSTERFGEKLEFGAQIQVETSTLDQLIRTYGVPQFIKIDVEGIEPRVLAGLYKPVPCVSFEVNLPEFRPEGSRCVLMLGALDPDGKFNFSTDCRLGLALTHWISPAEFLEVLASCSDSSIEVFWKSECTEGRSKSMSQAIHG